LLLFTIYFGSGMVIAWAWGGGESTGLLAKILLIPTTLLIYLMLSIIGLKKEKRSGYVFALSFNISFAFVTARLFIPYLNNKVELNYELTNYGILFLISIILFICTSYDFSSKFIFNTKTILEVIVITLVPVLLFILTWH